MVHPCSRPDCDVLTMGELCAEHEPHAGPEPRVHRHVHRLGTAAAVVALAAAGALVRLRVVR